MEIEYLLIKYYLYINFYVQIGTVCLLSYDNLFDTFSLILST